SPRRVRSLLREVVETLGDRRVALCRELTKLHEEVLRGRASEVLAALGDRDPRGEVVLVVEGAAPTGEPSLRAAVEEARGLIEGGMRRRQAATTAARRHGVAANAVYAGLLEPGN
ncbi:MAG TPA: rRNA (cytidine-2'-O-)-methyltransferase, partial [Actinomycetota bacterium]|nr:rRNA (cytidine-2'-O-)-methyltransferase [Actinomycetota bacterium]